MTSASTTDTIMKPATRETILQAAAASAEGRMHFKDVVGLLTQAGVESYSVDFRSRKATYYTEDDEILAVDLAVPEARLARTFDVEAIKQAILESQRGVIQYPEFKRRALEAGCTGYLACISGRQVMYFGRLGEVHLERFPT